MTYKAIGFNGVTFVVPSEWDGAKEVLDAVVCRLATDLQQVGFAWTVQHGARLSVPKEFRYRRDGIDGEPNRRMPNSATRYAVIERDGKACRYCLKPVSDKYLSIDHVLPFSRGGRSTMDNLVVCCRDCNRKKHTRTPEEAGMKLAPVHFVVVDSADEQESA